MRCSGELMPPVIQANRSVLQQSHCSVSGAELAGAVVELPRPKQFTRSQQARSAGPLQSQSSGASHCRRAAPTSCVEARARSSNKLLQRLSGGDGKANNAASCGTEPAKPWKHTIAVASVDCQHWDLLLTLGAVEILVQACRPRRSFFFAIEQPAVRGAWSTGYPQALREPCAAEAQQSGRMGLGTCATSS